MSGIRIKRWINMHSKEFHPDGTMKAEVRQQKISQGRNPDAIDDYARRLKEEYDEWKRLDETDPIPWPVYTAYDFFTPTEKKKFNPDGTLKAEYIEYALSIGISENALAIMERDKRNDVDHYNKLSARKAEMGINFGAQKMNQILASQRTYGERRKQMEIDLRNCEEPSSLPFDKDTPYF